ncbi:MAG: purine-nucleoside phosphorylase [Actinomycetota bacterium]
MDIIEQVRQNTKDATKFIKDRIVGEFDIGIILGSGLGKLVEGVQQAEVLPYSEIPHFPKSMVPGHAGNLVLGNLAGKSVAIMQGRFHYYEGYTSAGVTFPIRILKGLGVKKLIVTCAAGGLRADLQAGDIVEIIDHINLMGTNPLVGPNDEELGPRFLDMCGAYDKELREIAQAVARQQGINLKKGVYVSVLGPTYETPAELRFLSSIADLVGMSTVPEVIMARYLGIRVLGLAVVTNVPDKGCNISHEEVLKEAEKASDKLIKLIIGFLSHKGAD